MRHKEQGQILLITIMLLATAITIVMTVAFNTTTETQMTKLEEESQRAMAAAESALEVALKQGNITYGSGQTNDFGKGITGEATVATTRKAEIVTPLMEKDEQYTVYMTEPQEPTPGIPDYTKLTPTPYINMNVYVCFGTSADKPALEITLIKNSSIKRYAINPYSRIIIQGAATATIAATSDSDCPSDGGPYSEKYPIAATDIASDSKIMIVRLIGGDGRVGLKLRGSGSPNLFPLQGRTIVSEAKTSSGVTKRIQLFQSYPQVPADFFVTSF